MGISHIKSHHFVSPNPYPLNPHLYLLMSINLINSSRDVLFSILRDVSGMKALLLDPYTSSVVSHVASQSEIIAEQVFLVKRLSSPCSEPLHHLKALVFISPTPESITCLCEELKQPMFSSYSIVLTSDLSDDVIKEIALADTSSVVTSLRSYYLNFCPITPHTAYSTLSHLKLLPSETSQASSLLTSLLIALGSPASIRYIKDSDLTRTIASSCHSQLRQHKDLLNKSSLTQVLVMDRKEDPVSPVVLPWTYHAMIGEFSSSFINNRAVIRKDGEEKEYVFSTFNDSFFENHRNSSFGDVGVATHDLVCEFSKQQSSAKALNSIEDIQSFVESLPEFRTQKTTMTKHVAMVSYLAKVVEDRMLMDLGEVEQSFLASHGHSNRELIDWLKRSKISDNDKLRLLVMLNIKDPSFELPTEISESCPFLVTANDKIKSFISNRQLDLFKSRNLLAKAHSVVRKQVKGVANVYAQYQPMIANLVDQVRNRNLKESVWPFVDGQHSTEKPSILVVLIVGGISLLEAQYIEEFNSQNNGFQIILVGTSLLNSKSFLESIVQPDSSSGPLSLAHGAINKMFSFFS
ncbi:hypothetical protein P9112_011148 [Eukaryota sp. TZLM1-RC]